MTKTNLDVVGICLADVHLSLRPPVARSAEDDWLEAMAEPWRQVKALHAELFEKQGHEPPVILAGDLFDKPSAASELTNWALRLLPVMYGVPGQHDLPNHAWKLRRSSAFWTMVQAGRIVPLLPGKPVGAGSLQLWGYPWGFPVKPCPKPHDLCLDVAVVHDCVWNKHSGYTGADPLKRVKYFWQKLRGYRVAVFGDNHTSFDSLGNQGDTWIYNCILPDNWVKTKAVLSGSKSFYSGQAFEITTRRGFSVSVTPNHPVLTPNGFIPACQLQEGQQILCNVDGIHDPCPQEEQNRPSLIKDAFSSLSESGSLRLSRPPSGEDFHGDAAFFKGEVDVVVPKGKLLLGLDSDNPEHVSELVLQGRAMGATKEPSPGTGDLSFLGILLPSPSSLGSFHHIRPLIRWYFLPLLPSFFSYDSPLFQGHPFPVSIHGLPNVSNGYAHFRENPHYYTNTDGIIQRQFQEAATLFISSDQCGLFRNDLFLPPARTNGNAGLSEEFSNRRTRRPNSDSDGIGRLPVGIAVDNIFRIRKHEFIGHVYDLQTSDGLILANRTYDSKGIYLSNCGSFMRRKADEKSHRPSVGLIMSDGTVERHYLDVSMDKFIDDRRLAKVTEMIGFEGFLEELASLSDAAISYSEAVNRALEREKVPPEVKNIILAAMEERQ